MEEFLNEETIERYGMVNFGMVEQLKKEFLGGKGFLYNRIWLLIVLHKWLRKNS
jgi:asparagine synthase (glutamine-hydrolysing)